MADRKISQLASLIAPAALDDFVVVDASEASSADKNKRLSFSILHKAVPDGTVTDPSISFLTDNSASGFYRSAANEIAITANRRNAQSS